MSLPTTITVTLRDGKLINTGVYDKVKFDAFLKTLKDGEQVEVTYEKIHRDASYKQLARLHASIRAIADETGDSFEAVKKTIKERCGFTTGDKVRSFGDCSKEEIAKAIQECITVGDLMGVNLHG